MEKIKPIYFKNRGEWRRWLLENHDKEKEVWVLLYKKHVNKESLSYKDGVEEALCFGWIDGKMKRIDDEKHMQRFCPRTPKSPWSQINKDLALKLIKEKKMTRAGIAAIEVAKKNGNWQDAYTSLSASQMPKELEMALKKNKTSWSNFQNFANSYKNMYIGWVNNAKRPETKEKRIEEVVSRSAKKH